MNFKYTTGPRNPPTIEGKGGGAFLMCNPLRLHMLPIGFCEAFAEIIHQQTHTGEQMTAFWVERINARMPRGIIAERHFELA